MLKNPKLRRPVALMFAATGALLIFLAPETWTGVVLLLLGIAIELTGIALKRGGQPK